MSTPRTRQECLAELYRTHREILTEQDHEVDFFRPEDALGVAQLYLTTYGEGFPIDYVYDPLEITTRNAGPDLFHVVCRTERGDIIGLAALFHNSIVPNRKILEMGSFIVHPAYYGGRILIQMIQLLLELPERLELHAFFGWGVCDHLMTQKANRLIIKSRAFALEIDAMPPRPKTRSFGSDERVTLLFDMKIYHDTPHIIHLPDVYSEFLSGIYATRGLDRTLIPDTGTPNHSLTEYDLYHLDEASMVRLTVHCLGKDFDRHLKDMFLTHPDHCVYQLALPLWQPGVSWAVEQARSAGFYLGGLLPIWAEGDMLLMQKTAGGIDPARIHLLSEESRELLRRIILDRETAQN